MKPRLVLAGVVAALAVAAGSVRCSVPGLPPVPEFHLAGRHGEIACGECHTGDLRAALPRTCTGCHLDDRPDDHYTGDCEGCHNPSSWGDAQIDHTQFLPLGGGHSGLECTDCHAADTFEGLDRACESCHEPDRPANHFAGGCAGCHDVSGWGNATFDHSDYFPTPHRGVSSCASCHLDHPDDSTFSCTDCHEHSQARMNGEHDDVNDYIYRSDQCLRCHPDGRD